MSDSMDLLAIPNGPAKRRRTDRGRALTGVIDREDQREDSKIVESTADAGDGNVGRAPASDEQQSALSAMPPPDSQPAAMEPDESATTVEPVEAAAGSVAIVAHVDGLDPRGYLGGWAWVPDQPSRRVAVSAYIGGELVSFGTANTLRDDVRKAGFGDGKYGFSLPLPESVLDAGAQTFTIQFEGTGAATHSVEIELSRPDRHPDPALARQGRTSPALPYRPTDAISRAIPIYVPGQYIVCAAPYPRPPYHTAGWCDPEQEFTWIDGIEARIEMLLRRPSDQYSLTLDVLPNGVGGKLQTLEVFVNFFRLGFFEVREPTTLSLRLPSEIFILRKIRIDLHCREAVIPAEYGIADDRRRLGIAVSGWCIA